MESETVERTRLREQIAALKEENARLKKPRDLSRPRPKQQSEYSLTSIIVALFLMIAIPWVLIHVFHVDTRHHVVVDLVRR